MKQWLEDFSLKVQKDRKTQVALGAVVLLIVVFFLMDNKKRPPQPMNLYANQTAPDVTSGKMSNEEAYEDIVQRFSADLSDIKQKTEQNAEENKEIRKNLLDYEQRTADIFKRVLERIQENEGSGGRRTATSGAMPGADGSMPVDVNGEQLTGDDQAAHIQTDEVESFGMEETQNAPPPAPPVSKVAFVGAGDSVRIKLLAGVNAPTDGTPYPVVFKLIGDIYGPDGSALPLGEARLVAAAQGSLTDSRALFRLTSLNIRLPDGRRKVVDVDGWVVGEDGLRGMAGELIDPIGKAIAGAGMAGGIAGIGEGFAAAQLTQNLGENGNSQSFISGSVGTFAAGRGLAGAASAWSGIIKERISQLVPMVKVMSNREATAVFAKGFAVPGLIEALGEDDNHYSALD
ncbi:MAG: hypothetical protein K1X79_09520 [Oligoflexia bacterium]|nr:hypothetical protein [Oligoflexia bacterium]